MSFNRLVLIPHLYPLSLYWRVCFHVSEMQFGDRLTCWKIWKLNILFYLKVFHSVNLLLRSVHSIYCTGQMHNIKYIPLITDSHNVWLFDGLLIVNSLTFPNLTSIFLLSKTKYSYYIQCVYSTDPFWTEIRTRDLKVYFRHKLDVSTKNYNNNFNLYKSYFLWKNCFKGILIMRF